MGIKIELNPDLALREYFEHEKSNRKEVECIPKSLEEGKVYDFLKKDQRVYWLNGEIPLLITKGNEQLSRPIASIQIIEATHFLDDNQAWTKGKYKVIEVFNDDKVHFESYWRVGRWSK